MEKYWKFTAIIMVIVLSIGTFYVTSAMSATEYPEFVIKKNSGNDGEINSLLLEGYYHEGGGMNYTNTNVRITSDGSKYRNNAAFLNQIIGEPGPIINKLQEEHRNFMRGKVQSVNSFFENNKFLVYAEVDYKIDSLSSSDFKFDISILDKEEDDTTSFTIKVPDIAGVNHIMLEDVQLIDSKLKLITQNFIRENGKHLNEKHIYTVDISAKKISDHETIFSIHEQQGEVYTDARIVRTNSKQAYDNIVFIKTQNKIREQMESPGMMEESIQEIIAYNLKTKEKVNLDLPDNLKDYQVSFFDGSKIYLTKFSGQGLSITPFSLENNEAANEFTVQLPNGADNVEHPIIMVNDGKLYATSHVTNLETKATVKVVDVGTGEVLYVGEVVQENPPKNLDQFELFIYELSLK
ncbi:hypothetical protein [Virgibacillus sp. DJP39]|uniref:hypothetical protein n=1 Tax=Virgibacillus sp. DJP39 TaxID=3409790 RepID=UPI003BB6B9AC